MPEDTVDMFEGFDPIVLAEPVTLHLTTRDLVLIRWGLQDLLNTYTRHELIHDDIHDLLRRLPPAPARQEPPVS